MLMPFAATGSNPPIEFVGMATGYSTGTSFAVSLTSLTGGSASAPAVGDYVLVLAFSVDSGTTGVTTAGYTQLASQNAADTTGSKGVVHRKILTTAETSVTVDGDGNKTGAIVLVFRNVDPTTPEDVATQSVAQTNTGNPNPPSITPATSGAWIIALGATAKNGALGTMTQAGDLTDYTIYYTTDGGESVMAGKGFKTDWVSGAFDPGAWNNPDGSSFNGATAFTLALRPA